jgi:hypothetical protein
MRNLVRVVVSDANTGDTLPGANVVILDQNGNRTTRGGATNDAGVVILENAPGIEVRYVGYVPALITLPATFTETVHVELMPTAYNLPPVTIRPDRPKRSAAPLAFLLLLLTDQ